jgi:hypothetical protein
VSSTLPNVILKSFNDYFDGIVDDIDVIDNNIKV